MFSVTPGMQLATCLGRRLAGTLFHTTVIVVALQFTI